VKEGILIRMKEKDETTLVDKALGGDESAFEQLLHPLYVVK